MLKTNIYGSYIPTCHYITNLQWTIESETHPIIYHFVIETQIHKLFSQGEESYAFTIIKQIS